MPATPTPPDIPLPLDSFPPEIATWIQHTAATISVPTAAIAYPFLAGAGATIGNQLAIEYHL